MKPASKEKYQILTAVRALNTLGESPIWLEAEQTLYWIDLRAPSLHTYHPENGNHRVTTLPATVGAVVPRKAGGVTLCMGDGLFAFRSGKNASKRMFDLSVPMPPEHRMNDATCDKHGQLWCSVMRDFGKSATGTLYRIGPDGSICTARDRLTVPNGLCHDASTGKLYFTDTPRRRIEYADVIVPGGPPPVWLELCDLADVPGLPDGATLDSDGHIWCAMFGGGRLIRISPEGEVVEIIVLPVSRPTSCAFGGVDLQSLFITTARQGLNVDELKNEPLAGSLLEIRLPWKGQREREFAYEHH